MVRRARDFYWSGAYGTHATWRMSGYAPETAGSPARVLRRFTCHGRNDATTQTPDRNYVRISCVDFKGDAWWFSAWVPRD